MANTRASRETAKSRTAVNLAESYLRHSHGSGYLARRWAASESSACKTPSRMAIEGVTTMNLRNPKRAINSRIVRK